MWGHLRGLFFLDYPRLRNPGSLTKILYAATGFGHQAVMVFFVLSGFFISSAIFKRYIQGNWAWKDYAIDRLVRLYVVLVPGLMLGAMWDSLGRFLFAATGLYTNPLQKFGIDSVQHALTKLTFMGNMFFLQDIYCPSFGSNGPLWSLSNEFWYYVLFPVLFLLVLGRCCRRAIVGYGLLAAVVIWLIGYDRISGFVVWLSGCAVLLVRSHIPILSRLPIWIPTRGGRGLLRLPHRRAQFVVRVLRQ